MIRRPRRTLPGFRRSPDVFQSFGREPGGFTGSAQAGRSWRAGDRDPAAVDERPPTRRR